MNAKKIMGAVLVALLAAALFVGAGAALANGQTVFVYENTGETGTLAFTNEDGKTILMVEGVISGKDIVEGVYDGYDSTHTAVKINVMYPDAKITANVGSISILGGSVAEGQSINFGATPYSSGSTITNFIFTNPDGILTTEPAGVAQSFDATTNTYSLTLNNNVMAGEWKVQVQFKKGTAVGNLAADTATADTLSKTVYTFTVIGTDPTISASADSVITGNTFKVTVTGEPGATVLLTSVDEDADDIKAVAGQLGLDAALNDNLKDGIKFVLPASGKKEVALFADNSIDGKFTINADVNGEDVKVKITVIEGEVTAVADADFYYLGTDVVLSGTNTESKKIWFYIKGNNVAFQRLMDKSTPTAQHVTASVKSDKTWELEIDGDIFDNFDAGTYTVYAVAEEIGALNTAGVFVVSTNDLNDVTYAPVSVVLKQPFLTAQLSATVVAQDSKLTVTGTAEAADKVKYYIFGNNKFQSGDLNVDDDGTFEKEITIYANQFATGQYFVVIQHPMYDSVFNIGPMYYNVSDPNGYYSSLVPTTASPVGNKAMAVIVLNTTGPYYGSGAATYDEILFSTLERQSSNAAEALCQALDTQNIDDLYVKATFVVAQPTATINPVDDVAKGAKLVVSGTSNMAPGTLVTVEMLSTAFAAIPKESVNSASFITLTTKVQEDGTWEVEFDTTGLNVDEYTIGATVDSIKTPTVVVKVLESAPVTPEQPDTPVTPEQPEQPEQPTEPETPGFGALAALAGLGAVAVLLLRRE